LVTVLFCFRRDRKEVTRLRRFSGEELYGFQVATKAIDEAVRVAHLAAESGASWVDLNCGCPIHGASPCLLSAHARNAPAH